MSKATTCKDAMKRWEANTGLTPVEGIDVKLNCMLPPIEKMGEELMAFSNATRLSLSTN